MTKYKPRRMKNENMDWMNMVYASEMSSKAKLVAACLNSYMWQDKRAFPSLDRLAFETSMDRRSVQRALTELQGEGWLVKKPRRGESGASAPSAWILSWPGGTRPANSSEQSTEPQQDVAIPDDEGRVAQCPPRVAECHGGVAQCHGGGGTVPSKDRESNLDTKREEKKRAPKKKSQPRFDPMTLPVPASVDEQAWRAWWDYKGGKWAKSTITATANIMEPYSPEAQRAMVNYSVAGGYSGVYEDQARRYERGQQPYKSRDQQRRENNNRVIANYLNNEGNDNGQLKLGQAGGGGLGDLFNGA